MDAPEETYDVVVVGGGAVGENAADRAGPGARGRLRPLVARGATVTSPDYAGRARVLVDTEREVLLGATSVGPDAGALVGTLTADGILAGLRRAADAAAPTAPGPSVGATDRLGA
jgi:dihydrolipoamide dehydrogenase